MSIPSSATHAPAAPSTPTYRWAHPSRKPRRFAVGKVHMTPKRAVYQVHQWPSLCNCALEDMRERSAKWQEIWKRESEAVRASLRQAQDSSTASGQRLAVRLAAKSMELSRQKREAEEAKQAHATALSVAEQKAREAKAEQAELERIANDLRAKLNEQEEARFVEQGIANEACRGLKSEKEERKHFQGQCRLAQREVERLKKVVVRLERERKVCDSRHRQVVERCERIIASKDKQLEVNGQESSTKRRTRYTTAFAQNSGDELANSFSESREAAQASLRSMESNGNSEEESRDENLSFQLDEIADIVVRSESADETTSAASSGENLSRGGSSDPSGTSSAHTSACSETGSHEKTRISLKEHVTLSLALLKTRGQHHGLKSLAELRIGSRLPILSRHGVLVE
ncbi:hypothetical protein IE81DRAFT_348839 [Ceraceosorus guamensis]|uniref:Uncharacterized protein n=1 Tax=Ceraceosorus guamensis TaxID=1522189 RepID=A0A316VTR6_9BASI|nr:hypothetical protein IE81DRAFT_348839 [Ceraceosorus guamensis]PWN40892.1 hypothetical protein IE81DRAFT_348839 [Ceraceosorus guamensis]